MKYVVPIIAIIAIVVLDGYALYLGHNGALLLGSLAAIAGIGGYHIGKPPGPASRKSTSTKIAGLLVIALMIAIVGCSGLPAVEVCYVHPKYGKVCAVRVNGNWFIKADLGELDEPAKVELLNWVKTQ